MRPALRASIVSLPIVLLAATMVFAQAASQTATAFYMQYRKAFDAAKKVDDLFPYMSADTIKQIQSTPAAERGQMFEMIKMMGALTNVKVAKETKTATGAQLTVNATDPDKKPTVGTIDVVQEGGKWKIGKESWSSQ